MVDLIIKGNKQKTQKFEIKSIFAKSGKEISV